MYGHPSVIKLIARVKEHLKHGQHGLGSFRLGPKSVNVFGHGALQIQLSYIKLSIPAPASLNYIESAIKQKIRYILSLQDISIWHDTIAYTVVWYKHIQNIGEDTKWAAAGKVHNPICHKY